MVGADSGRTQWVVLLEAADESGVSTVEADSYGRLVTSWAVSIPTTLYSTNRYARQVTVDADDAPTALGMALSQWKDALKRSALPEWLASWSRATAATICTASPGMAASISRRTSSTKASRFANPVTVVMERSAQQLFGLDTF